MIGRSSFCRPLGIFQEKVLVVLYVWFSGTVMLVLASLVPSLALVCVYLCSCVFHMLSHQNLRVELLWKWFRDSTFISGSVRVLLFNEAL